MQKHAEAEAEASVLVVSESAFKLLSQLDRGSLKCWHQGYKSAEICLLGDIPMAKISQS